MKNRNKAVILIVDDQPPNIFALERLLEDKGRTLLSATSGQDALKMTLKENVDLIILDVQMPDMDGFEVAQILRSNNRTKDIPIIFATAVSKEHHFVMKGYEEGAVDYLYKPLNGDIVKAKVSVLLKLQAQKKMLVAKNIALEKSDLLINNSADIIGIIDGQTLQVEQMNQAFTSILGYTLQEIKGTAITFFLTNESRQLLNDLQKTTKEQLSFETAVYSKNREIKWLQWNVVVKNNKWFVNARNITEVKEVERIRNYLATVVLQSNDAIYIHDKEGKIISWNQGAEKIYGYSEREALQMRIWNIVPEYMKPETGELINSLSNGKMIQDLETKRITKHGKLIDVLFSASEITDTGEHLSVAITERDITYQKIADEQIRQMNKDLEKRVEEKTKEIIDQEMQYRILLEKRAAQLQASNTELERFAFVASHDLQEPLRMVTSFLTLLDVETHNQLSKDAKEYINYALDGAERMKNLIYALLQYARLDMVKDPITLVDTDQLVNSIYHFLEPRLRETNASLIIHPLPTLHGVEPQLLQLFENLIGNALKYHNHNSPIVEVGCKEEEHFWRFYVKDNGIGIDPEYHEKIFIIFQRLHDKTAYSGTGIGLAICKKIVEKHEGSILVESEPGKGSTFYFTIAKRLA